MAPQVGLEPTTFRLTAERSAIELLRNIGCGKDVSYLPRFLFFESGDDLLSRAVSSQVPSACWGLTSVFGMGTGGSLRLLSPEILCGCQILLDPSNDFQITIHIVIQPLSGLFESLSTPWKPHRELTWNFTTNFNWLLDQALDRLVSSSSIRYRTSTDDLSTSSSLRGLTCF